MVANLQTYIGKEHPYAAMNWQLVPAFYRVGLDPSVDDQEAEDLSEDMEAAMAMLR